jgi:hypothetical protein
MRSVTPPIVCSQRNGQAEVSSASAERSETAAIFAVPHCAVFRHHLERVLKQVQTAGPAFEMLETICKGPEKLNPAHRRSDGVLQESRRIK